MPPSLLDQEESDLELSSGDEEIDENTVFDHPYTGERYNFKSLRSDPKFTRIPHEIEECWEPGHSCRKNWESMMRTMCGDDNFSIPEEFKPLRVIPRDMWGAAPATEEAEPIARPLLKVVYHYHIDVDPCNTEEECSRSMRELQRIHMEEQGLTDVAYNFVVGGDSNIYVGRGWLKQPDNCLKYPQWRHRRLDIAFMGKIDENTLAPDESLTFTAFEFLNIGVAHRILRIDHDLYENEDPPLFKDAQKQINS